MKTLTKKIITFFILLGFISASLSLNTLAYAYMDYGDDAVNSVIPASRPAWQSPADAIRLPVVDPGITTQDPSVASSQPLIQLGDPDMPPDTRASEGSNPDDTTTNPLSNEQPPTTLPLTVELPDGQKINFTIEEITSGGQTRTLRVGKLEDNNQVVSLQLFEKDKEGKLTLKASAESLKGLPYQEGDKALFIQETKLRDRAGIGDFNPPFLATKVDSSGGEIASSQSILGKLIFVDRLAIVDNSGKEKAHFTQTSYVETPGGSTDGSLSRFSITTQTGEVDNLTLRNADSSSWRGLFSRFTGAIFGTSIKVDIVGFSVNRFDKDNKVVLQARSSDNQTTVIDTFDAGGKSVSGKINIGKDKYSLTYGHEDLPEGEKKEVLTISESNHSDWIKERITTQTNAQGEVTSILTETLPNTDRASYKREVYSKDPSTGEKIKNVTEGTVYGSHSLLGPFESTYKLVEKDGASSWIRTDRNSALNYGIATPGIFTPMIFNLEKQFDHLAFWETDQDHWKIQQFANSQIESSGSSREVAFKTLTHGMEGSPAKDLGYIGISAADTTIGFVTFMHPGLIAANFVGDPTGTVDGFADIVPGIARKFDSSSPEYDPRRGIGSMGGFAVGGKALSHTTGIFKTGGASASGSTVSVLGKTKAISKDVAISVAQGLGTVTALSLGSAVAGGIGQAVAGDTGKAIAGAPIALGPMVKAGHDGYRGYKEVAEAAKAKEYDAVLRERYRPERTELAQVLSLAREEAGFDPIDYPISDKNNYAVQIGRLDANQQVVGEWRFTVPRDGLDAKLNEIFPLLSDPGVAQLALSDYGRERVVLNISVSESAVLLAFDAMARIGDHERRYDMIFASIGKSSGGQMSPWFYGEHWQGETRDVDRLYWHAPELFERMGERIIPGLSDERRGLLANTASSQAILTQTTKGGWRLDTDGVLNHTEGNLLRFIGGGLPRGGSVGVLGRDLLLGNVPRKDVDLVFQPQLSLSKIIHHLPIVVARWVSNPEERVEQHRVGVGEWVGRSLARVEAEAMWQELKLDSFWGERRLTMDRVLVITSDGSLVSFKQGFNEPSGWSMFDRPDASISKIVVFPDGSIYNPAGGVEDILNQQIRLVGKEGAPIRMDNVLRAIRFKHQYGFEYELNTQQQLRDYFNVISDMDMRWSPQMFEKLTEVFTYAQHPEAVLADLRELGALPVLERSGVSLPALERAAQSAERNRAFLEEQGLWKLPAQPIISQIDDSR